MNPAELTALDLLRMVQCGLGKEMGRAITPWQGTPQGEFFFSSMVAAQRDPGPETTRRLQDSLRFLQLRGYAGIGGYLASIDAVAHALERDERLDDAIDLLERTSQYQSRTRAAGKAEWLETQRHLARLYRAAGRSADATSLERKLSTLALPERATILGDA